MIYCRSEKAEILKITVVLWKAIYQEMEPLKHLKEEPPFWTTIFTAYPIRHKDLLFNCFQLFIVEHTEQLEQWWEKLLIRAQLGSFYFNIHTWGFHKIKYTQNLETPDARKKIQTTAN